MSPRRRALVLGGLALVLGGLAASNVAGREAALQRRVGGLVDIVVAREPIESGSPIRAAALAVRRVPRRFAPTTAISSPRTVVGLKAATEIARGTDLTAALVDDGRSRGPGPPIARGERIATLVALGSAQLVTPGSRVDIVVTPEPRPGEREQAVLALEDKEVLESAVVGTEEASGAGRNATAGERVAVSLRVSVREAVYLAAAQDFARELRLLPRAGDDRRHGSAGLRMSAVAP